MVNLFAPLLLLTLLALAVARGLNTLAVFCAVLVLAMVVSDLWARLCFRNLSYSRHLERERIFLGQEAVLQLEFVNAKPLPLAWLLVRDRLPRGLELVDDLAERRLSTPEWIVSLVSLRWYERVVRNVHLRCSKRGVYDIGPSELSSGDVFGYRRVIQHRQQMTRLVVYPRLFALSQLALAAGVPQGEFDYRRRLGPDPLRFEQLRAYLPGDNPKDIHWRATARSGQLQVKEYEPSAAHTVIVALDVQTMPRPYDHVPVYLEQAISTAASLAVAALDARWSTGLAVNGPAPDGSPWQYIESSRQTAQAARLLTVLASLTPYCGDPFETMLGALQPRLPQGASIVAVTAQFRPGIWMSLLSLQNAHHPVCLYIAGDQEAPKMNGLRTIHLGGSDAWQQLQSLAMD